jgi:hypothetical protein
MKYTINYIIIGTIETVEGEDPQPTLMVFPTLKDAQKWAVGVTGNFEIRACKGIDYDAFDLQFPQY